MKCSTYLGHAHVIDTYWYLTGTPELLGAAGKHSLFFHGKRPQIKLTPAAFESRWPV